MDSCYGDIPPVRGLAADHLRLSWRPRHLAAVSSDDCESLDDRGQGKTSGQFRARARISALTLASFSWERPARATGTPSCEYPAK
jgi:hypothetical protein